jgi:hypothetical protein
MPTILKTVGNLQVTFVKNAAGAITGIVLRQGVFDSTGVRLR